VSELTTGDSLRLRTLHWLARAALRFRPPLQAKALVDRVAPTFRSLDGVEAARAAVRVLFPAGSCLSRALTIAAAVPRAEVVIGVDAWSSARLSAHAWLRIDDVNVDTSPHSGTELPTELAWLPSRRL
jgi:hypothetical protein